jgi:hypothetical protein
MPDPADREPDDETTSESGDDGAIDFDAEFTRLVADWGPTPEVEVEEEPASPAPSDEGLKRLLRQAWPDEDPQGTTRADAEDGDGHYEPPPPPPIPRPEPRRLAAWVALFGAPILGLVLLVSPFRLPSLVGYGLFAAFVGGFGYLVWTMGAGRGDGWDDGARL